MKPGSPALQADSLLTEPLGKMIPGLGRSSGVGDGNPLQYSCLENPMDRVASQVHGIARVRYDLTTKPPPYHFETALYPF